MEIAAIKVAAPHAALKVIDWAIQAFGAGGVADHIMANAYAYARTVRIVDGPDEVHRNQMARLELRKYRNIDPARTGGEGAVYLA